MLDDQQFARTAHFTYRVVFVPEAGIDMPDNPVLAEIKGGEGAIQAAMRYIEENSTADSAYYMEQLQRGIQQLLALARGEITVAAVRVNYGSVVVTG